MVSFITRLPEELIYECLGLLSPPRWDWNRHDVQAQWFLNLRLVCRQFDDVVLTLFLNEIRRDHGRLPLNHGPLCPSRMSMGTRLLTQAVCQDRGRTGSSLICTILHGADTAVDLLGCYYSDVEELRTSYSKALISTVVGLMRVYAIIQHLAGKDDEEAREPDEDEYPSVALIAAANLGRIRDMEHLIDLGADIHYDRDDIWLGVPLAAAAIGGQAAAVGLLVARGVNPNDKCSETNDSALHHAATGGHTAVVEMLLGLGVDLDSENQEGERPLLCAAAAGHVKVVQLLLSQDTIDINAPDARGNTPLIWATQRQHKEVVAVLLQHKKIDVNYQPRHNETTQASNVVKSPALGVAASTRRLDIFQLLLAQSHVKTDWTNNMGHSLLQLAVVGGNEAIVRIVLDLPTTDVSAQGGDGSTPLMWAVQTGDVVVTKLLLSRSDSTDLNLTSEDRLTALTIAAISPMPMKNRLELVKLLLERKDLRVNVVAAPSNELQGASPLGFAASAGYVEVAKMLLARPDVDDQLPDMYGRTPLSRAVLRERVEMVRLLLEGGRTGINQADNQGYTPLLHAVDAGYADVLSVLLEHADLKIEWDGVGDESPLQLAAIRGHENVMNILLSSKASLPREAIFRAIETAEEKKHTHIVALLYAYLASGGADEDTQG